VAGESLATGNCHFLQCDWQWKAESGTVNIPLVTEILSFWMTGVNGGPIENKTSHRPFQISFSAPRQGREGSDEMSIILILGLRNKNGGNSSRFHVVNSSSS
jgi:hypothetical protein